MGLWAEGQFEAAADALRAAIRSNPDDAEIRLLLAEVYLDPGTYADRCGL